MLFRPMSLYDYQERLLHTPSNQCGTTHVRVRVQLRRVFCVCGRQKENSYTSFMTLFDGNQFGQCAAPPPRSSHNAYDAFVRLCLLELNGHCAIRWSAMAFRGNRGEPCQRACEKSNISYLPPGLLRSNPGDTAERACGLFQEIYK
jgi:hypothetical protein